jgi:hypothetical protein
VVFFCKINNIRLKKNHIDRDIVSVTARVATTATRVLLLLLLVLMLVLLLLLALLLFP